MSIKDMVAFIVYQSTVYYRAHYMQMCMRIICFLCIGECLQLMQIVEDAYVNDKVYFREEMGGEINLVFFFSQLSYFCPGMDVFNCRL